MCCDPSPLVVLVLEWLAEEFDEKRRTSHVPSTKALGEMFRSDAKGLEGGGRRLGTCRFGAGL